MCCGLPSESMLGSPRLKISKPGPPVWLLSVNLEHLVYRHSDMKNEEDIFSAFELLTVSDLFFDVQHSLSFKIQSQFYTPLKLPFIIKWCNCIEESLLFSLTHTLKHTLRNKCEQEIFKINIQICCLPVLSGTHEPVLEVVGVIMAKCYCSQTFKFLLHNYIECHMAFYHSSLSY